MRLAQLYLIQEGMDGPVKIGRSACAKSRRNTFQTGNSQPLKLVAVYTMEASEVARAEQNLQLELAEYLIGGEWFDIDPKFLVEQYMKDFFLADGFEVIA
jgi:hypothetical protein